jgi:hypothetical protein
LNFLKTSDVQLVRVICSTRFGKKTFHSNEPVMLF